MTQNRLNNKENGQFSEEIPKYTALNLRHNIDISKKTAYQFQFPTHNSAAYE